MLYVPGGFSLEKGWGTYMFWAIDEHLHRVRLELEDGWLFQPAWTITSGPLATGTFYDFLSGLFGWSSDPERIRVIAYVGYLVPVLWLFLKPDTPATKATADAPTQVEAGVGVGRHVGWNRRRYRPCSRRECRCSAVLDPKVSQPLSCSSSWRLPGAWRPSPSRRRADFR